MTPSPDIRLLTAPTPNGWKISIMLEELVEAGALERDAFEVEHVDIFSGAHKTPEYAALNPNLKIPTLVAGDLSIMESCTILQYLAERFPSAGLLPSGDDRWRVLQWVTWQAASVGPVFGNKLTYTRYLADLPEEQRRHPLARFGGEARRLAGVLDTQLEGRDWVCGDYSIADIAIYPWIRGWKWSKVDITDRPNVMAWKDRMRGRPGVDRGLEYGAKPAEVDQWTEATKQAYARGGASLAQNEGDG